MENGFFTLFGSRLFIVGGDAGVPEPVKRIDPVGPEYQIKVEKKKKKN